MTIIYYVQHSITFAVSVKSVSPTDKQMLVPTLQHPVHFDVRT
jgi:hypothetical protein